uniref:Uncharacterized protein n=1 Tax=Anguilla anguilla TaxID=7936 RepID=A0A0E9P550_ANGAN
MIVGFWASWFYYAIMTLTTS